MGYNTKKEGLDLCFTFGNRSDLLSLCSDILLALDERICYQNDYKEILKMHVENAMRLDNYAGNKSFILPLAQKLYRTYDFRAKNNSQHSIEIKTIYNELVNIWNELTRPPED